MFWKIGVIVFITLAKKAISSFEENVDDTEISPYTNSIFKLPPTPPTCAKGSTFCVNIKFYPFDKIFETVTQLSKDFIYFGIEDSSPHIPGVKSNDHFVCETTNYLMFPQVALNTRNQWKYIVNLGRDTIYHQAVTIEKCVNENRSCDSVGVFAHGYIVHCKQKYAVRRLIAIEENGEAKSDTFMFPLGCCCAYRKINL